MKETVTFALRGINANKLRSALTTLGILIGVAAVIILVAVGTGSSKAVQDSISRLGSNTLTVTSTSSAGGGRGGGGGAGFVGVPGGGAANSTVSSGTKTRANALTVADAQSLTDHATAPDVLGVAPVVSAQSVVATYQGASHTVNTFTGTTNAYLLIDNDQVSMGTTITDAEADASVVAILAALRDAFGAELRGPSV